MFRSETSAIRGAVSIFPPRFRRRFNRIYRPVLDDMDTFESIDSTDDEAASDNDDIDE